MKSPEIPPECQATIDRLQVLLDGEASATSLLADPHALQCPACSQRIAASALFLKVMEAPLHQDLLPQGLNSRVLAAVGSDKRKRTRLHWAAGSSALAAAAVLIAAFLLQPPRTNRSSPETARVPPQVRLDEQFTEAGAALSRMGRKLAEPEVPSPHVFAPLAEALSRPAVNPLAVDLEPAARTLAELPNAARAGLEPLTDNAYRAFHKLLQDVSFIHPTADPKPKS